MLETHHPQSWASYDIILTLLKDGIAYEGAIPVRKEFTCKGPKVSKRRNGSLTNLKSWWTISGE